MIYSPEVEQEIKNLTTQIEKDQQLCHLYPPRWLAIQLLEGEFTLLNGHSHTPNNHILKEVRHSQERLLDSLGSDIEIAIPEQRYQYIQSVLSGAVQREVDEDSFSDKLDRVLANRYFGLPIFLVIMYLVFNIVQNVSAPYLDWIDGFFNGIVAGWITALLNALSAPAWLHSLLVDGILAGVGGVLVFLPSLFAMYAMLSVLEQTGYMSRAAYVMDRFMNKVGLHGKSFIPMILGFGCNVPAIYATRTIEKREARLLTGLLIPFMSCSARLPIYLIFGIAFFPHQANLVIFLLYFIGIVVAAAISVVVSKVVFKNQSLAIMVMELPAYQLPNLKTLVQYAWRQSAEFIQKAGTIILGFSVLLWLLLHLPLGVEEPRDSYYGQLSNLIAPSLAPAGFGNWESSGALVTGLVAKELVVSNLAQVYGVREDAEEVVSEGLGQDLWTIGTGFVTATVDAGKSLLEVFTPGVVLFPVEEEGQDNLALSHALQENFTPLSAASFMVFTLLYIPCVATIGAQKHEFGWKWAALSVMITMLIPWILAVIVYQGGSLLGWA